MKRVVLTGNGLSVALNPEFSLKSITDRFFHRLDKSHQEFIQHHMRDDYSQLDFEEAIASIEQVYDSLAHYYEFLVSTKGKSFLDSYDLKYSSFDYHLKAIQHVVYEYTSSILDLIDNNVRHRDIEEKLQPFVDWLLDTIDTSDEIDLFTLNFDLLLETILLTYYNKDQFADFHFRVNRPWSAINNEYKYYFDPDRSKQIHPAHYANNVRLHHLHGSLSSFKDLENGKVFKITTEALRDSNLYENIFEHGITPSIVTGGGKSLKVQQNPFHFYYNEFKKSMIINENLCDELYIIGYSFRDEHINKAIRDRLKIARKREQPTPLKIVIVDYANNEATKHEFVTNLNDVLEMPQRLAFQIDDGRILFGGANNIKDILVKNI